MLARSRERRNRTLHSLITVATAAYQPQQPPVQLGPERAQKPTR